MLYSLMSTKFRRAFQRILSCRLGRAGAYYDPRETTCATPSVAHAHHVAMRVNTRLSDDTGSGDHGEFNIVNNRHYAEKNGHLAIPENNKV